MLQDNRLSRRFRGRLERDHQLVTNPDVDTPFADQEDVVNRLLPYHVFQHPQEDLDTVVSAGKGKSSVSDIQAEIRGTVCVPPIHAL